MRELKKKKKTNKQTNKFLERRTAEPQVTRMQAPEKKYCFLAARGDAILDSAGIAHFSVLVNNLQKVEMRVLVKNGILASIYFNKQ